MDVFIEQLVPKAKNTTDTLKKVGICTGFTILALAVCFVAFAVIGFPTLGLLGAGGLLYLGYYLMTGVDCEYEYIVSSGDMDIDKIIAQRKRKRMLSVKLESVEAFGRFADAKDVDTDTTIVSAVTYDVDGYWYADFTHSSYGKVRLIFSPEKRTVEAITTYLPTPLKIKARKDMEGMPDAEKE